MEVGKEEKKERRSNLVNGPLSPTLQHPCEDVHVQPDEYSRDLNGYSLLH